VLPGYEGLVHISELDTKRVESPEKAGIVTGSKLDVKYLSVNEKGQMRLSRRAVLVRDTQSTSPLSGISTPSLPPPNPVSLAAEAAVSVATKPALKRKGPMTAIAETRAPTSLSEKEKAPAIQSKKEKEEMKERERERVIEEVGESEDMSVEREREKEIEKAEVTTLSEEREREKDE